MGELQRLPSSSIPPPPPPPSSSPVPPPPPPPLPPTPTPRFDPSRMVGIIRRRALIKELAAVYHTECLAYCQELLELQRKMEEPFADTKSQDDVRKELVRPQNAWRKSVRDLW